MVIQSSQKLLRNARRERERGLLVKEQVLENETIKAGYDKRMEAFEDQEEAFGISSKKESIYVLKRMM